MSHFTVLVVTNEKPTGEVLEKALAPFHEFECTGVDNEYVQDIDVTEKLRKEYLEQTESLLKAPDGTLLSPYDDRFYRDPTPEEVEEHGPMHGTGGSSRFSYTSKDWGDGKGYRAKVRFVPEGYEPVEVPTAERKTFAAFVEDWSGQKVVPYGQAPDLAKTHKYGYVLLTKTGEVDKVIDRTNPNAEWDWYVLGGRWHGMLLAKRQAFAKMEVGSGGPGLMGSSHENAEAGGVDWCRIGDLDLERMKNAAVAKRQAQWVSVQRRAEEKGIRLSAGELDTKRRDYVQERQRIIEAWRKETPSGRPFWTERLTPEQQAFDYAFYDFGAITTEDDIPIQEWIDAAPPLSTFAVLMDGKWTERGDMGWWGVVSDEKDERAWAREYEALLRRLRPDQFIAVVDCHI